MAEQALTGMVAGLFAGIAESLETGRVISEPLIAITALGSEHGEDVIYTAAEQAAARGARVCVIGTRTAAGPGLESLTVGDEKTGHEALNRLLGSGAVQGCVTMHYPFPIGVATVGRIITPAAGREMFLATTTGTASTDRAAAMARNAISGIAVAKACGVSRPTLGILNLDGARQAELALRKLQDKGYGIRFAQSSRQDGGLVMRGNDLIAAACDVMVTDSLTGNILMKLFSAYQTGGTYEAVGFGYGPGMGEALDKLILIISRASGVPVARNAILFAAELARNGWRQTYMDELAAARRAGLDAVLGELRPAGAPACPAEATAPPKEIVTGEILGIEIMDLDNAVQTLRGGGIYAESGMGCTGPVVLVSEPNLGPSRALLAEKGYIGL